MRVPFWTILLFQLFLINFTSVQAQDCSPTDNLPGPYICWPYITNISGSTANYSPISPPPLFCNGTIENNGWFSFSPCQPRVAFSVIANNCQNGNGLEAVIYDQSLTIVSNCLSSGAGTLGGNIVAENLTPGEIYYFMVDGFEGDLCDFVISGGEGLAPASNQNYNSQSGYIQGPSMVCNETQTNYTVVPPTCSPQNRFNECPAPDLTNYYDTIYHWTLPVGATIIGDTHDQSVIVNWEDFQAGDISVNMEIVPLNNSCVNCIGGSFASSSCTKDITPLSITERPTQYTQLPAINLCEGECFQLNNQTFCEGGQYQVPLIASDGCDSIVEFEITIYADKIENLNDVFICSGECVIVAGQQFCTPGQKQISLNTSAGCDSIILFKILEKETSEERLSKVSICEGSYFEINGKKYFESGDFQTTFIAHNGCDSTVFFEIEVLKHSETILPVVGLCAGENYELNGETYDVPGIYKQYKKNQNGCDSIIILEIFEQEDDFIQLPSKSICPDECIVVWGKRFCEGGTHQIVLQNQNGCDSTIQFELEILEEDSVWLPTITLCKGECYEINERRFCEAGQHKIKLQNQNGCDSLVLFEIEYRELKISLPENAILTTDNSSIQLNTALDGSPENLKIDWEGFSISPNSLNPIIDKKGTYILTVTDTILGCSSTDSISVFKLNAPPSTSDVTPANNCSYAPFVCGESLQGLRGKTKSSTFLQNRINQLFRDSLENPEWIEWFPCDSTVILQVGVLNSLYEKGIEFSIVRTDSCEQFDILVNSKKIRHKTVEEIQIDSLTDSGHYFFVFDGIDGDASDFQLEIIRGIQTEPLSWEISVPPLLDIPETFCPDVPVRLSVTKPKYKLKNEHCSFFAAIKPRQNHAVKWNIPVQATDFQDMAADTVKEIVFKTEDLLPFGSDYLANGQILSGLITVEFEPKITLSEGIYCRFTNPQKFEKQKEFSVDHELQILKTIDICDDGKRDFCGNKINFSQEVICRQGCLTTVQFVNVFPPQYADHGYVRLCPGECYTMPITGKVICSEGEYTEPIRDKCGGTETVTIGFRNEPEEITTSPIQKLCDQIESIYRVNFTIRTGRPPYKVDGEYINGNRFISNAIPSGDPFVFRVTDASVCPNETFVSGTFFCGPFCTTESGTMETTTISICANEIAKTTHHENSILDSDDGQEFILHNNPNEVLGQVFARSTEGDFAYIDGVLNYDSTYFVSSVVGTIVDGQVDLDDPCLAVSKGQPVVFKKLPNLTLKDTFELTCASSSIEIVADNSPLTSYLWTLEDGSQITSNSIVVENSGSYQVQATGTNGCSLNKTIIVAENRAAPIADAGTLKEIFCDQSHVVLNGSGSSTGNHLQYEWQTPDGNILDGKNSLNPRVNEPGTYYLSVSNNENSCQSTDSVIVAQSDQGLERATFDIYFPTCYGANDGRIAVNQIFDGTAPYEFSFDGGDFSPSKEFEFLQGGTYQIIIRDAHNCTFYKEITLVEPPMVAVELGDDEFITLGDNITLTAASNILPHSIEWWNDLGELHSEQLDWKVKPTETTTYYVRIEDRRGCFSEDEIDIIVKESDVFIPTGFSPNNDEQNDFFTVFGGESVNQVLSLKIYNRAGNLLFENYNFPPNKEEQGWDGFFRGKQMFADVYVFLAEVEFINGDVKVFQGDVTLVR